MGRIKQVITQSEYGGERQSRTRRRSFTTSMLTRQKNGTAAKHPEVIAEMRRIAEEHKKAIPPVDNQLDKCITAPSGK